MLNRLELIQELIPLFRDLVVIIRSQGEEELARTTSKLCDALSDESLDAEDRLEYVTDEFTWLMHPRAGLTESVGSRIDSKDVYHHFDQILSGISCRLSTAGRHTRKHANALVWTVFEQVRPCLDAKRADILHDLLVHNEPKIAIQQLAGELRQKNLAISKRDLGDLTEAAKAMDMDESFLDEIYLRD